VQRIILATCNRWPELSASDRLYGDALVRRGVAVSAVPWNGPVDAFSDAAAVVLRSTWDYHYDLPGFRAWLDALEGRGLRVHNAPALVRWNLDKRYLGDLAERGVSLPKTRVLARDSVAVAAALDEMQLSRAVLKPLVGASGHNVRLVSRESAVAVVGALGEDGFAGDVILQEFVAEVRDGELSLVFFDGRFSHAFRRRPPAGEFRVNSQYGGVVEPATVPADAMEQARAVLAVLPETPLYARVDGVLREGRLLLMELELLEPGLALDLDPDAAGHFAEATLRRLDGDAPLTGPDAPATPG